MRVWRWRGWTAPVLVPVTGRWLKGAREWARSWALTLRIMIFERELYHILREPFDPADYVEVGPYWLDEEDPE
jgi:hypothetical protein